MLLTPVAQRLGVKVFHDHAVDVEGSRVYDNSCTVKVKNNETKGEKDMATKFMIDATGRSRRFASIESRIRRFKGWNYSVFWAYFEC